jgi:hypothetical protein
MRGRVQSWPQRPSPGRSGPDVDGAPGGMAAEDGAGDRCCELADGGDVPRPGHGSRHSLKL